MSLLFCWAEHFAISRRNMPVHVCVSGHRGHEEEACAVVVASNPWQNTTFFFLCAKICNFLMVVFTEFFFFLKQMHQFWLKSFPQ